jgi:hypothetical protein
MSRRVLWTLPLLLVALSSVTLHAQAKLAIYGTGGVEKSDLPFSGWNAAGTFGFYFGLRHYGPVDLSADVRGDLSSNIYSGILGPRLAVKLPIVPIMPYGEFLFGGSSYSTLSNGVRDAGDSPPRRRRRRPHAHPRFDWRGVEALRGITQFNESVHPKTVTTGFVVRF